MSELSELSDKEGERRAEKYEDGSYEKYAR